MSNENKLSPVTVFVPVNKTNGHAKCFWHNGAWHHSTNVEEQERYVFDREGLEKLLGQVWQNGFYCDEMLPEDQMPKYIQSLFKQ